MVCSQSIYEAFSSYISFIFLFLLFLDVSPPKVSSLHIKQTRPLNFLPFPLQLSQNHFLHINHFISFFHLHYHLYFVLVFSFCFFPSLSFYLLSSFSHHNSLLFLASLSKHYLIPFTNWPPKLPTFYNFRLMDPFKVTSRYRLFNLGHPKSFFVYLF